MRTDQKLSIKGQVVSEGPIRSKGPIISEDTPTSASRTKVKG